MSKKELKIKYVIPTNGFTFLITFDNGSKRELDCEALIKDKPKFNVLNENNVFWYATVDRFHKNIVFTENVSLSIDDVIKYSHVYDFERENKKLMKLIYNIGKETRKRQKITQNQIADIIGIPQSSIARLEKGDTDVQLSTILNYLSPLGLSIKIVDKNVPNKKTLKAMFKKDDKKSFHSVEELWADLKS